MRHSPFRTVHTKCKAALLHLSIWYSIRYHTPMRQADQNTQHHTAVAAAQLQAARLRAGLSLRELAARAGTSHATLLAYEQGKKSPAITTFLRILEAAGFAVDIQLSKRIREFFEDILPENINELILNLNEYRKTLKGNFEEKVDALNEITKSFKNKKE